MRRGAVMIKWIKIYYGNYQITQQYIKLGIAVEKGVDVALYGYNSLNYEIPQNKNINNNDIKCLNIEIISKTSKNVIISCIYRPSR